MIKPLSLLLFYSCLPSFTLLLHVIVISWDICQFFWAANLNTINEYKWNFNIKQILTRRPLLMEIVTLASNQKQMFEWQLNKMQLACWLECNYREKQLIIHVVFQCLTKQKTIILQIFFMLKGIWDALEGSISKAKSLEMRGFSQESSRLAKTSGHQVGVNVRPYMVNVNMVNLCFCGRLWRWWCCCSCSGWYNTLLCIDDANEHRQLRREKLKTNSWSCKKAYKRAPKVFDVSIGRNYPFIHVCTCSELLWEEETVVRQIR